MSSSSTSGPARACSPARCSKPAHVWSRSSGTRPSRPGCGLGSEATSRSSKPTSSSGVFPNEPFAVVANLPFAGSGAILSRLLRGQVTSADVIVEWGFAEKHAAIWPATLKGAYWRTFYEVELARRLDRTAFAPPPSVDAAVLRFTRRMNPLVPTTESQRYWRFLSDAFHATTEVRRSVLTPLQVKRLAPALGFRPSARPRDLDACQWAGIYAASRRKASGVR